MVYRMVWYGVNVTKIDDLDISPHYWNKKMFICITDKKIRLLHVKSWNTMFSFNNKSNIYIGDRTLQ